MGRVGRYIKPLWALALVVVLPAQVAFGEGLQLGGGGSSRMALFQAQANLLDGKLSQQYSSSGRLRPDSADQADSGKLRYDGRYRGAYLQTARRVAERHGVPADLFLRLVNRESGWNPGAVSPKGAVGLAQLMPETALLLGVDPTDPEQNLEGGARYLRMMFDRFGSWRLALAAYNAGPLAVEAAGGIPDYAETRAYVAAILG